MIMGGLLVTWWGYEEGMNCVSAYVNLSLLYETFIRSHRCTSEAFNGDSVSRHEVVGPLTSNVLYEDTCVDRPQMANLHKEKHVQVQFTNMCIRNANKPQTKSAAEKSIINALSCQFQMTGLGSIVLSHSSPQSNMKARPPHIQIRLHPQSEARTTSLMRTYRKWHKIMARKHRTRIDLL